MLIRSSARALAIALLPLAFIHAVLFALALLRMFPSSQNAVLPITDYVLVLWLACIAIDGALLFLGHLIARHFGSARRSTYAWMGGVAAVVGYAIAIRTGIWISRPEPDVIAFSGILPTIFGMISGFLYAHIAGYEPKAALTPTAVKAKGSLPYDGPIQVRTSIAAITIAALIPAAIMAVIALFVASLAIDITMAEPTFGHRPESFLLLAMPAQLFILALIATSIPTAIFTMIVHAVARSMRRVNTRDYAIVGGLVGAAFGAVFSITGAVALFVPLILLGAIVSASYRGLAGIEPLSLPEPVLVRAAEALVPADHPSRKTHLVITDG